MKSVAICSAVFSVAVVAVGGHQLFSQGGETRIPLSFSGGHKTDRRDGGRPVVLVAAGLGVSPDVFREAFRGVTPARGGPPTGEQVHRNKEALLRVLEPHGVTNDRLDEVSDYYRYRPERGEMWRAKPAKAYAVVEEGKIKKIVVTNSGSGYSSPPKATVKGINGTRLVVKLQFSTDLKKNGSIATIEIAAPKEPEATR